MEMNRVCILLVSVLSVSCPALAEHQNWVEGSAQHNDGATRQYYNAGAALPWKNFMGDWRDAKNVEQGESAYAVTQVIDDDSTKPIRWEVTALVREWIDGKYPNQGMFLRVTDGNGLIVFASRESSQQLLHPTLELTGVDGSARLEAVADTSLTPSTYRSQGHRDQHRISSEPESLLVRFDLKQAGGIGEMKKATLRLHSTQQYGTASIGVFRCRHGHEDPRTEIVSGIAATYPRDRGIAADPRVVFATDFEREDWQDEWTLAGPADRIDTIAADESFKQYQSLQGKALRSRIAKGEHTAMNTTYKFAKEMGQEPEEIYFRYYVRLADDWNQTIQGGKLPGISGTYGRAGWGGRKSNGTKGWSARGLFKTTVPEGNPLAGRTPVGFYCYHADMTGSYGTNWIWNKNYLGYLKTNRWYAIEQYCHLNTPDDPDGVLRAWVDGRLAFEKTDIRFRLTDKLKIEQIWMNLYHGGKIPSPRDQHLFVDNVVIAREYIGPMATTSTDTPHTKSKLKL